MHTPGAQELPAGMSVSRSGESGASSARRAHVNKHSCGVCYFRSRNIADMASHHLTTEDGAPADELCSGAPAFRNSYAHAVWIYAQTGGGSPHGAMNDGGADCCGVGAHLDFPADISSPPSEGASSPHVAGQQASDTVTGHSGPAAQAVAPRSVHACSAPLSDIMARLWQSTNPDDLVDILTPGSADRCSSTDPDDSESEENSPDTDMSAASSSIGDEHVMALLEHILTACTPVAEAHALLSIPHQAGTVPWRTMEPYLKVLREWHHECGRGPVLSVDLRIPVGAYQYDSRQAQHEQPTHVHMCDMH